MSRFAPTPPPRPNPPPSARRGVGLIHLIGGIFVSALVLGVCVPLFLTGQRYSEMGRARSRMTEQARRISGHLREDIRQASAAQVQDGGATLRLTLRRALGNEDRVVYRSSPAGMLREVQPGRGRAAQRDLFSDPLPSVRFERSGSAVRARLSFDQRIHGRHLRFSTDCTTSPRAL